MRAQPAPSRRCNVGAAIGALVVLASIAPRVHASGAVPQAAVAGVCDAAAKPAKLTFTFKDLTGARVSLRDFAGKVILLDFWATWCVPCRTEIPGFVDLQHRYGDRGLQVIGVSVDDPIRALRPYVAEMKMSYPVLLGDGRHDILDAYGPVTVVPTSVLIGRDGVICTTHSGAAPMEVFEREIAALL